MDLLEIGNPFRSRLEASRHNSAIILEPLLQPFIVCMKMSTDEDHRYATPSGTKQSDVLVTKFWMQEYYRLFLRKIIAKFVKYKKLYSKNVSL